MGLSWRTWLWIVIIVGLLFRFAPETGRVLFGMGLMVAILIWAFKMMLGIRLPRRCSNCGNMVKRGRYCPSCRERI